MSYLSNQLQQRSDNSHNCFCFFDRWEERQRLLTIMTMPRAVPWLLRYNELNKIRHDVPVVMVLIMMVVVVTTRKRSDGGGR